MTGFDINVQKEAGDIENEGAFIHINGLDDLPMYYPNPDFDPKNPDKKVDGVLVEEELPVGINVAGAHSRRFREIEGKHRKRRIKQRDLTGHKLHADSTEKVVHCTLSWQGFFSSGTKLLDFTPHNVRSIYNLCPWVLDQVTEGMNDHSLFGESKSDS